MGHTHDPIRRCSKRRCSGQLVRSGAESFAYRRKRALALRFTDLKLGATLVHVIGTAKGHQGPWYSKVSVNVIKRRHLLSPIRQKHARNDLVYGVGSDR